MGIEYYLVNKESKTFYELGKGSWYCFNDEIEALTDLEYLEEFIFDDCLHGYDEEASFDKRKYAKELALELFEFAKCNNVKNVILINDCTDDKTIIKCLKFTCVGSRYRSDDDPGYNKECIDLENRHLNSRSHMYRVEDFNGPYGEILLDKFRKILP